MDLFRRLFGKSEEELTELEAEATTNPLPAGARPTPPPPPDLEPVTTPGGVMFNDGEITQPKKPDALETVEVQPTQPITVSVSGGKTEPLPPMPMKLGQTTPLPVIPDGTTRPLAPDKALTTTNQHLIFGQASDIGLVRTNNQDSAFSFFATSRSAEERPDCGLFIVADGMGGHHEGEKASSITTRVVAQHMLSKVYMPFLTTEQDSDRAPVIEILINAIQKANSEVMRNAPDSGTTATSILIVNDLAHIAHVGDSRAYLLTHDGVEQITRDHSLVQRLIELGQLTHEEAADHPQKNVLYRALGQSETLEVDTLTRRLTPGARLLICSDGLWSQVSGEEMLMIALEMPPQQACDKLVALANTRGGTDNITVIILKIPG